VYYTHQNGFPLFPLLFLLTWAELIFHAQQKTKKNNKSKTNKKNLTTIGLGYQIIDGKLNKNFPFVFFFFFGLDI